MFTRFFSPPRFTFSGHFLVSTSKWGEMPAASTGQAREHYPPFAVTGNERTLCPFPVPRFSTSHPRCFSTFALPFSPLPPIERLGLGGLRRGGERSLGINNTEVKGWRHRLLPVIFEVAETFLFDLQFTSHFIGNSLTCTSMLNSCLPNTTVHKAKIHTRWSNRMANLARSSLISSEPRINYLNMYIWMTHAFHLLAKGSSWRLACNVF